MPFSFSIPMAISISGFPQLRIPIAEMRLLDYIDIFLVFLLVLEFIRLVRGTNTLKIFIGIVSIYILWKIVSALEMEFLSEILGRLISVGVIALIVVFQPEIRRFLLMLGTPRLMRKTPKRFLFFRLRINQDNVDIDALIAACGRMSASLTGALMILARQHDLEEYAETGEKIDSRVTARLLESIFFKNSTLHDGAVIIRNNRIRAAACILPLTRKTDLPVELGLRHRAALGISEITDAFSIAVSEENGNISYCRNGEIIENVSLQELKTELESHFSEAID
jgi:uncharacterized protein (TIGR00159 family)